MGKVYVMRPPQDDDELWEYVYAVWGMKIPRIRQCPNPEHSPPFQAFADAYFARWPVSVWKASRGFGGKSQLASILACTIASTLGVEVGVAGGSGEQSKRVISHISHAWGQPNAPVELLRTDPGRSVIELTNGGKIVAQTASTKSVRGPHPVLLMVDECDEVDMDILHTALGQPMSQKGITARTVLASTHQYPDGPMTWALKHGKDNGWGIFQWCYRCNLEPHGWLPASEVERKRKELPAHIFAVEIELQEPAIEGRAIDTTKVEDMFDSDFGYYDGVEGEIIELERPHGDSQYAHGLDLARKQDYTVMVTFKLMPNGTFKLVAFRRYRRRPWDEIGRKIDEAMAKWGGYCLFDATGVGDAAQVSFKEPGYEGFMMTGGPRLELYSAYVAAIERDEIRSPRIRSMYEEHKYCRVEDLWKGQASEKFHTPDTVAAGALAYRAALVSIGGDFHATGLASEPRSRVDYGEVM
jgi:hypothetical protein